MKTQLKTLTTATMFALATAGLSVNAQAERLDDPAEVKAETNDTLEGAAEVLRDMKEDNALANLLDKAQGVFLIPNYARVALGVGASGGEGVLLVRDGSDWSGPMFYNIGAVNAGIEAGIEAGQIAMVLQNEKAVETFMDDNNFSLNADAGLSIIDYSARGQASWGKGDIVVWTDTEGAFADIALSVENIMWDDDENTAYYGSTVGPQEVASGKVSSDNKNPALMILTARN
ncbi:lipid-binding SYLF domain-containing protein [Alteromonas sp. ASW11-130]|uniref:lipid-binding SYLF domain-containing protein n=1 Tax=Alteromonas sp. ASW11-130 TaxID=3015775 RepID=UPI00224210C7|nr:lipid-binding SYLF domain-containing protein [Alteromonas sp. ASW11-130]MCW8092477.1 lipid-binding SYLF domain-containing protein [Alteromonas sp. ASW11-130]